MLTSVPGRGQTTIASDTFELGDHPTGNRTVTTGGTDGIVFYTHNSTGASYSPGIVSDPTFGSLVLNNNDSTTGSAGEEIIGLLPTAVTLVNPNDFITLNFSFRYLNVATASANSAGFRFGIESSNGTVLTGDNHGTTADDDLGYYIQNGVGTTAPAGGNTFYNEAGGTAPILGGTDRAVINATTSGVAINDDLIHTASFTITLLSATSIKLSMVLDGTTTVQTNASTTNIRTTFDEIAFGDGFVTSPVQFNLDNVQVVSNVVPEPGSAALLAASSLLLLARCRRR
ncbi:PEP-CTERM sorting domain-containing protein [Chthoniobacter flavus]|uniref:PEP-CTERM sorting domain-containing protein n=1 Tax=Chthoniobacter flavus TaxID=191863 RepID=UPI00030C1A74|nr:PEP-CTERM sorting domain-containing protein [Chthoniobacter flavus]